MDIVLIGAFSELFELCEECGYKEIAYVDNNAYQIAQKYKYLGDDNEFISSEIESHRIKLVIVPDSPTIRMNLFDFYRGKICFEFPVLASPSAKLSHSANFGVGTVIQWGAHVSSNALIGNFVKINVLANIMHDTEVGDFTTIAPNASIMGRVRIGRLCYIGANATILPGLSICDNVVIGGGAVVTGNVIEKGTYAGVPARRIK